MELQATFTLEPHQVAQMIKASAPEYGRELARQNALSKTYKVDAELSERLQLSERTIRQKIRNGELRATPTGESKGYRVTEQACREFLGDLNPDGYHLPE